MLLLQPASHSATHLLTASLVGVGSWPRGDRMAAPLTPLPLRRQLAPPATRAPGQSSPAIPAPHLAACSQSCSSAPRAVLPHPVAAERAASAAMQTLSCSSRLVPAKAFTGAARRRNGRPAVVGGRRNADPLRLPPLAGPRLGARRCIKAVVRAQQVSNAWAARIGPPPPLLGPHETTHRHPPPRPIAGAAAGGAILAQGPACGVRAGQGLAPPPLSPAGARGPGCTQPPLAPSAVAGQPGPVATTASAQKHLLQGADGPPPCIPCPAACWPARARSPAACRRRGPMTPPASPPPACPTPASWSTWRWAA